MVQGYAGTDKALLLSVKNANARWGMPDLWFSSGDVSCKFSPDDVERGH